MSAAFEMLSPDGVLPRPLPPSWRKIGLSRMMHPLIRGFRSDHGFIALADVTRRQHGRRWLHISVSHRERCPTWEEMCDAKDIFIGADRVAVQVHPRAAEHVSLHPYCLHLWCDLDADVVPDLRSPGGGV